jgi:hypothetical protein
MNPPAGDPVARHWLEGHRAAATTTDAERPCTHARFGAPEDRG